MLSEPMLTLGALHEAHIYPHRFLNSRCTNVHDERIRQISRSVLPGWKRRFSYFFRIGRAYANAERRSIAVATSPSFPKQSAPRALILSLTRVAHPQQFDHGICKRK